MAISDHTRFLDRVPIVLGPQKANLTLGIWILIVIFIIILFMIGNLLLAIGLVLIFSIFFLPISYASKGMIFILGIVMVLAVII
jgi:hypothetical protein